MIYSAIVKEMIYNGIYRLNVPGIGSTLAYAMERGDAITYKAGDEVFISDAVIGDNKAGVILGYVPKPQSSSVVGNITGKRDDIGALKGIEAEDGDVILKPSNDIAGKETYLGMFGAGYAVLQASNNSYIMMSGASKATFRANFINIIAATHSEKSVLFSGSNVGCHRMYNADLTQGNLVEEIIGYIGKAPGLQDEVSATAGTTEWTTGIWKRIGGWALIRADDTNKKIQLNITDKFAGNIFVSAFTRQITLSPDEFSMEFGVTGALSTIKIDKTGILLQAGLAKIKIGVDGIIEQEATASSIRGSDDSFVTVNKSSVAIQSSAKSPTVLASPIELVEEIKFNRAGVVGFLPNFYYDSKIKGWNLDKTFAVGGNLLVNEVFLQTKWIDMLKSIDTHVHSTLVGPTSPPSTPIFFATYGFKPGVDTNILSSYTL